MKKILLALFFLTSLAHSQTQQQAILQHKFEDAFPPGVQGHDWFSQMAYDGHKLQLIKDGADVFDERRRLIMSANRSILLSTYIYGVDKSSTEITDLLCLKAKWGVDVRVIVDSVGSKKFYKKEAKRLRKCGVGVQLFQPGKWDLLKVVKTMHEKLLIIDGRTVYLGGRGIGNSYHQRPPTKKFFYDMDIIVEGAIACWWQFKFIDTYHKARQLNDRCSSNNSCRPLTKKQDEALYGKSNYPVCFPFPGTGNSRVIPLYGNPIFDKGQTPVEDAYVKALENLEMDTTVKLYAPYFVPTKRFGAALVKAKKEKRARISIITNSIESNDEGIVILAAMGHEVKYLLKAGIDIRLYPGPDTLHRKVGVFGGKYGHIGSDNLDSRGQHYQTESVIFTDDESIVRELESEFDNDYRQTILLTPEYIKKIHSKAGRLENWFSRKFKKYF